MGRRKKFSTNEASPDNAPSLNINLELSIKALKARNQQLAQALATALQDKAQKITEINALHAESFDLHNKFAMLQNIVSSVNMSAKECLPMLNQLVSMFTKVIHLTSPGTTVSNFSYTPDKDRRTQTVIPRTVNGHVLSNPTINLSRMVDSSTNSIQETNAETSTNLQMNSALHVVIDRNDIQNIATSERNESVERRNRYATTFNDLMCDSELSEDDDTKLADEETEQSDIDEEEEITRLGTVPEEDEENLQISDSNQSCCKEMRVCLQPLCPSQIMNTWNTGLDSGQTTLCSDNKANDTLHASQGKQSSIEQSDQSILQINNNESGNSSSLSMRTDSDADLCESTAKKICYRRGKQFEESDSLVTFNASPAGLSKLSLLNNTSLVENSSPVTSQGHGNETDEKTLKMYDLGLMINSPQIATSTPIGKNIVRTRSSTKLGNCDSPISTVTTKRGSGEAKKLDCAVRGKIKLEKRLSGSPIKKIGDIFNDVSVKKVSDIVKLKRGSSSQSRRSSNVAKLKDEELDSCSSSSAVVREERLEIKRNIKHSKTKGKENELKIILTKKSPRPKRSARPGELKEPNLLKKLRRSK